MMKAPRKLLYAGVAVLGIALLSAYAWNAQRPAQESAPLASAAQAKQAHKEGGGGRTGGPIAVEVAKVVSVRLQDDLRASGNLQSKESVMLRPEVAGRVAHINFVDGQRVSKGQLLLELDTAVARAELQQAEAELRIAKANLQRNAELAQQRFIAERVREESAANVQVLEAKLALVQARLAKLQIRAPFAGVVGISDISVGDYVKDGVDIAHLTDISQMKVDFRVPEKFIGQIRVGQTLEVTVDAYPQQTFHARVEAIDPQVESNGRSVLLRGRIPNQDNRLKPGMFARVRLVLSERGNALVVPEEALVPHSNETTVWKITDGKAQRVMVKTGLRREGMVEVTEGLQVGDTVVTAGQVRLNKDGAPVRVVKSDNAAVAAADN